MNPGSERGPSSPGGPPREATPTDAGRLLALKRQLDGETRFMLLEAAERTETVADVGRELERRRAAGNSVLLVAERGADLVGYIEAVGGTHRRDRSTASVVLGVLAGASGQGVGARLLAALEHWARPAGVHRLELTVMADNHRAIHLYQKMGFVVEGRRRHSLVVDGDRIDELSMARLIETGPVDRRPG
ncbi:MAG TPA: GNAT family N-acetyltransferase [Acidimicrobiales bacterium]|nr:GNAT family N-acetyltransferase [Acidimicrobiales bacterium]